MSGVTAWPVRPRQQVAGTVASILIVVIALLGHLFWSERSLDLPAPGVAVDGAGRIITLAGSRPALSPAEQNWLDQGRVPAAPAGSRPDLVQDALVDLHTLGHGGAVPVAGWSAAWRYVWPRDTAFVIDAYARTGHRDEAVEALGFLQRVQGPDGRFQARYRPDGREVPDARGIELDGSGWALWSLAALVEQQRPEARAGLVTRFRPLLDRSTSASRAALDPETHLPPAGLDYWEVPGTQPTLATGAVLLSGLRAAQRLYRIVGESAAAQQAQQSADQLQDALVDHYEAAGYPRLPGGRSTSVDLGVTFLMAPFADVARPAARAAWARSPAAMTRPAGGLAPGGSWRNDGISWTPTVATYAVAASCADPAAAVQWLSWLDRHRTASGALPEKVLADGSPASVAPLAWTSAAVVIAADQLERGCRSS